MKIIADTSSDTTTILPLRSLRCVILLCLTVTVGLLGAKVVLSHVRLIFFILALISNSALLIRVALQSKHQAAVRRWLRVCSGSDLGGATNSAVSSSTTPVYGVGWGWLLLGWLVLAGALAGLEMMQPYYFAQDDNLVYNPPVLVSCQSLERGVFPTWNPYELMGEVTSSQTDHALTYPFTYLAYFIARHILGQQYLFNDVFCILHLLLGYAAMYWAARVLDMRPALAMLAALAAVLSGCALIMGRSYFHTTPVLVWMPLLIVAVAKLQQGAVNWRWVLFTGGVIGFACHSGNGQMWTYEVCFFLLAVGLAVSVRAIAPRAALWVLPALLLGLAIGAPLIVPQAIFASGLPRVGRWGGGISAGLAAMLLPYPLARAPHPNGWGSTDLQYMGEFYYSGTLFVAIAGLCWLAGAGLVIACHCDSKLVRDLVARNLWLLCAGVAFDLALGPEGISWPLTSVLPIFKWYTGPFKLLLYLNIFIVLGAGVVLERILRQAPRPQSWEKGLVVSSCALVLYQVSLARPSFYSYGDKPYPVMPQPMRHLLSFEGTGTPQRTMPFAPERSAAPGYLLGMKHSVPCLYNVLSTSGYNPFVALTAPNRGADAAFARDPLAAAHAYGVGWLVEHRLAEHPLWEPNHVLSPMQPGQLHMLHVLKRYAHRKLVLPEVSIWELKGSDPLAFAVSRPAQALPLRYSQVGVDVDVTRLPTGGRVVVNILQRPYMQARAGALPLSITADAWGRMVVAVPAGAKLLTVRYVPPWRAGFACGAALWVLAILCMAGLTQITHHKDTKDTKKSQRESRKW